MVQLSSLKTLRIHTNSRNHPIAESTARQTGTSSHIPQDFYHMDAMLTDGLRGQNFKLTHLHMVWCSQFSWKDLQCYHVPGLTSFWHYAATAACFVNWGTVAVPHHHWTLEALWCRRQQHNATQHLTYIYSGYITSIPNIKYKICFTLIHIMRKWIQKRMYM
jgi:hypothetical protein